MKESQAAGNTNNSFINSLQASLGNCLSVLFASFACIIYQMMVKTDERVYFQASSNIITFVTLWVSHRFIDAL